MEKERYIVGKPDRHHLDQVTKVTISSTEPGYHVPLRRSEHLPPGVFPQICSPGVITRKHPKTQTKGSPTKYLTSSSQNCQGHEK